MPVTPTLMQTNFKGHIPSLDGFRAISILLVVFAHLLKVQSLPQPLVSILKIFAFGDLGVRVFFVISGFLITYLLIREKERNHTVNVKAFYLRRVFRIFPVFYFYLIVVFIYNKVFNLNIDYALFFSAGLYIQNFSPWGFNWLIAHTWSLAVEEQFYLIWPFLFKKLKTFKLWIVWIAVLGLGAAMRALSYKYPSVSVYFLAPFLKHADFLFSGCFLAFLLYYKSELLNKWIFNASKIIVYLAILAVWAFSKFEFHPELDKFFIPVSGTIINACVCFLLIYFILKKESFGYKLLNNSIIAFVGKLSYSLYLWQQLFLVPGHHKTSSFWWTQFPVNLIFVFATAYFSYLFIEKPFLKLKEKFKV
jgi:peptidoglycan/LPS O-acetylase OafA/YrhL